MSTSKGVYKKLFLKKKSDFCIGHVTYDIGPSKCFITMVYSTNVLARDVVDPGAQSL